MRKAWACLLASAMAVLACGPLSTTARSTMAPATERAEAPAASTPTAPYLPPECANAPLATLPAILDGPTQATPSNPRLSADQQRNVLDGLVSSVRDNYIYPDAAGPAWAQKAADLKGRVEAGMETEAFYAGLQELVSALGDDHSYFQTPLEIAAEAAEVAGTYDFVGVGALFQPLQDVTKAAAVVVFEDGPAWRAGLRPHDTLLAVDGGPIRTSSGISRTRGPACSAVVLTVQSPGEPARDLTMLRAEVTGSLPVDPHLVTAADGARIGYVLLPTLLDKSIPETVRSALESFGPLDGLILDNRLNGGGLGSVAERILGFFTSGNVGAYVTRQSADPLEIEAEPIFASQTMPLVVLVSPDTVSYGEITSGILRDVGRAKIVGETTLGNVEQLHEYDFEDGSRTWLADARFVPAHSQADWEATGIVPDVEVRAGWETFTFDRDPAIPAALKLMGH